MKGIIVIQPTRRITIERIFLESKKDIDGKDSTSYYLKLTRKHYY